MVESSSMIKESWRDSSIGRIGSFLKSVFAGTGSSGRGGIDGKQSIYVAAALFRISPGHGTPVDEVTWTDLAMDEVFAEMDRTASVLGRQVLYSQLRCYARDREVLNERSRQRTLFREEHSFRDAIRRLLTRLERSGAESLLPFLHSPLPLAPRFGWVFLLMAALTGSSVFGCIFFPRLVVVTLAFALINAVTYLTYGQRILPHFTSLSQISSMLCVAEDLGKLDNPHELP